MTKEIKDRIEQISSGKVPEGYVRTRAGIMPKDWFPTKTASQLFKNHSDKKHNGEGEVLSATQDRGIVPRSEVDIAIKYAEESVSSYKKVESGDFVISLRSFQGGIEYSQYNGLVSPAYTVLKPVLPVADDFYKAYFKTADFISRLNSTVYGIRDGKQIGFSDFGDMILHYPHPPEQQKIAEILTTCDKLIALQQCKVEEIKALKNTCLSKMFPKQGNSVPEIRFPGFTDAWKQRKVGELTKVASAARVHKEEWASSGVPFFRSSDVVSAYKGNGNERAFISRELYEQLSRVSGKLEKDDILVTGGGSIGIPYLVSNNEPLYSKDADLIWIKRSDCFNSQYMFTYLTSPDFRSYLNAVSHIGTIAHYTIEQVKETPVYIPSVDEQKQIGTFFRNLENLIALHQRELEEMGKYKKALMQLLLTGIVRVS